MLDTLRTQKSKDLDFCQKYVFFGYNLPTTNARWPVNKVSKRYAFLPSFF